MWKIQENQHTPGLWCHRNALMPVITCIFRKYLTFFIFGSWSFSSRSLLSLMPGSCSWIFSRGFSFISGLIGSTSSLLPCFRSTSRGFPFNSGGFSITSGMILSYGPLLSIFSSSSEGLSSNSDRFYEKKSPN